MDGSTAGRCGDQRRRGLRLSLTLLAPLQNDILGPKTREIRRSRFPAVTRKIIAEQYERRAFLISTTERRTFAWINQPKENEK